MTIKVAGTLQEPRTDKEVLPGVKEALRRLQTELPAGALPDAAQRPQPSGLLAPTWRR